MYLYFGLRHSILTSLPFYHTCKRFMSGWGNWGCDLSEIVKKTLDRLDGGVQLTEDGYRNAMLREFG
jgi:hypothetical protein